MTLEEYLNQENPVRNNQVFLQEGEYDISNVFPGESYQETFRYVSIHKFPHYSYILRSGSTVLWAEDGDGNPSRRSVFHINL